MYPIYIAFGAVFLANILKTGWKKYLQPVAVAVPVLFFVPMYNVAFPNKSPEYILKNQKKYKDLGLLRWEDGKDHPLPQDFADMLGWQELAYKLDEVYSSLPDQKNTLVMCDNYGQAGAINYYTKSGIKAVSFNADYINWFNFDQQYTNLIRVTNFSEIEDEWNKTKPYFKCSSISDSVTNKFAREYGTTIFLFKGATVDINETIKNEIKELKKKRRKFL